MTSHTLLRGSYCLSASFSLSTRCGNFSKCSSIIVFANKTYHTECLRYFFFLSFFCFLVVLCAHISSTCTLTVVPSPWTLISSSSVPLISTFLGFQMRALLLDRAPESQEINHACVHACGFLINEIRFIILIRILWYKRNGSWFGMFHEAMNALGKLEEH